MLRGYSPLSGDGSARRPFAARMTGAGEQPGRERPHPRNPDPDPWVGSGSLTSRLLVMETPAKLLTKCATSAPVIAVRKYRDKRVENPIDIIRRSR